MEVFTQLKLGSHANPNVLEAYSIANVSVDGFFCIGMVMPLAEGTLHNLIPYLW
jgi:hypothetical protein